MVTFLLFLSFLLNIVSLLSIVLLYSRQNRYHNVEKDQKRTIAEIEDIISSYMVEMKEENDEFIQSFRNEVRNSGRGIHPEENNQESTSPDLNHTKWTGAGYKRASKAYLQSKQTETKPIDQTAEIHEIPGQDPLIQKVITMKKKGMSLEEIAKAVGKGQTEIELLLKFRQIM
ncbi:hypothetical protein [Rossellomorea sp. NPDC077527]|uniref:hypothetical protein n=1 Tax=Rossellomorea sp. NPDC077527 TaxID=3364510 RepID=UPI0037CB8372